MLEVIGLYIAEGYIRKNVSKKGFYQLSIAGNDEIKNLVKGPSLMGNIMEILPKISMVGKDLEIQNGGHCGKCGQTVAVSDGSPHIKIDSAKVGGQKWLIK